VLARMLPDGNTRQTCSCDGGGTNPVWDETHNNLLFFQLGDHGGGGSNYCRHASSLEIEVSIQSIA
jgi:hypothetical protein